jgi:Kef-type K+ transport system membrane component KefB
MIGPTVLGRAPGFSAGLFPKESIPTLGVIANIGLVFFLFTVGMELDADQLKADLKPSLLISAFGIGIPLITAVGVAYWLAGNPEYVTETTDIGIMTLFLTVILGISALPVLARILSERNMLTSRLGSMSMSVAAIDDVLAWVLLAIMLALVSSASELGILWALLLIIGECLFVFFIIRPLYNVLARREAASDKPHMAADTFIACVFLLFVVCYLSELIGVSSLIGAFQAGLVVPRSGKIRHYLVEGLEPITVAVFMPLYFAYSGLRTDFGYIDSAEAVGVSVALIIIATISKIIGIVIPARMLKIPWRLSMVLGVLMSCKGLIALIVVNYGLEFNIITPKLFAILILMVLITTMQTVPLVLLIDPPSRAEASAAELKAWEDSMNANPKIGKEEKEDLELVPHLEVQPSMGQMMANGVDSWTPPGVAPSMAANEKHEDSEPIQHVEVQPTMGQMMALGVDSWSPPGVAPHIKSSNSSDSTGAV